jgi:simple sugar transport system ATP-binding protein
MTTQPVLALEAANISKRFGALQALHKVSFRLRTGSFHALLGENGAGKSTLVKCIMGYYRPDDGEVLVGDRQQVISNPHQAAEFGIGMVYQHFTLIPNMTVLENLMLVRPHLPEVIDWRRARAELGERMRAMPFQVPLDTNVNRLSAGEKQKLEIIKQLLFDCRILILDEPTSVLTPTEADEVLGRLRELVRQGDLSVLMITHKFREVLTYADEVTVLRKGRNVGSAPIAQVNAAKLAEMMVGESFAAKAWQRRSIEQSSVKLRVRDLGVLDDGGATAVKNLSLDVHPGEIVGVAGVSGNGQRELIEALAGQRQITAGEITVAGERYRGRRAQMIKHRFHCLPEEPIINACVTGMSIAENLVFRRFDHSPFARGGWWINRRAMRTAAVGLIEKFRIQTPGPDALLGELSGGNVQRTVLARELSEEVEVLVAANPCFGLDFAAVAEIHSQLMAARNRGAAVLLVSEDLDEILALSDRIVVMSGGSLVYETTPKNADPIVIGRHMAGHSEGGGVHH